MALRKFKGSLLCNYRYDTQHDCVVSLRTGRPLHMKWNGYSMRRISLTSKNGDLLLEHYDNKEGQEQPFMEAISTETLGEISWLGEDGETWQTTFKGNSVVEKSESYLVDAPITTYQPLIP